MSDTNDSRANTHALTPETVPPDKCPGHERDRDDDPVVETTVEDAEGNEWFAVGNESGVVCTRDPLEVVR